jgi:hypothetical protein
MQEQQSQSFHSQWNACRIKNTQKQYIFSIKTPKLFILYFKCEIYNYFEPGLSKSRSRSEKVCIFFVVSWINSFETQKIYKDFESTSRR